MTHFFISGFFPLLSAQLRDLFWLTCRKTEKHNISWFGILHKSACSITKLDCPCPPPPCIFLLLMSRGLVVVGSLPFAAWFRSLRHIFFTLGSFDAWCFWYYFSLHVDGCWGTSCVRKDFKFGLDLANCLALDRPLNRSACLKCFVALFWKGLYTYILALLLSLSFDYINLICYEFWVNLGFRLKIMSDRGSHKNLHYITTSYCRLLKLFPISVTGCYHGKLKISQSSWMFVDATEVSNRSCTRDTSVHLWLHNHEWWTYR